jgi:transposase
MPRKSYTREFKLQALRVLTDQGLSVAEVARRLGAGQNCLRNWRQAGQQQGEAALPRQGNLPAAEDELRRLRAETQRLRPERGLLTFLPALGRFPVDLRATTV